MALLRRHRLDAREQIDVVFEPHERRHEDVQVTVAHFDAQRRLDNVPGSDGVGIGRRLRASRGNHRRGGELIARRKRIDRRILFHVIGLHVRQ
jgi:hypothetical protein